MIACAAAPTAAWSRPDAVSRAMTAAGGEAVLRRVLAVAWRGTARMMLGKVPVDLNVETRIEPFVRGRSDTWLEREGRSTIRTVMVERDSAFLVHEGAQTALAHDQARFERQQFGAYAYLLLAPAFVSAASATRLNAAREGYPPIALTLARNGRIAAADYRIATPDQEGRSVRHHFTFAGSISSNGVHFPRVITIAQDGRPLSRLTIRDFSVELDPV
jgi:hypothetical protein